LRLTQPFSGNSLSGGEYLPNHPAQVVIQRGLPVKSPEELRIGPSSGWQEPLKALELRYLHKVFLFWRTAFELLAGGDEV